MPRCTTGLALQEEYENALKCEAIAYGRLIAHKRRHEDVNSINNVRHMQLVTEAARRYMEGEHQTQD